MTLILSILIKSDLEVRPKCEGTLSYAYYQSSRCTHLDTTLTSPKPDSLLYYFYAPFPQVGPVGENRKSINLIYRACKVTFSVHCFFRFF